MNDDPSPLGRGDNDGPSSPKRKKMRQKYAPKACVSCRRSKLKCTGENPCQRCVDNNKRCFYSEDQTAAEVLQNLSRPAPVPLPHTPSASSNGEGGGGPPIAQSRRLALPRHDAPERRASDASALSTTMESRMARIEVMMEALIHERGLTMTPKGSVERDDNGSDGLRSETAFSMPLLDPIHPALAHMRQPSPNQNQNQNQNHNLHPSLARAPSLSADLEHTCHVRVGDRTLMFPEPALYHQYMAHFFGDVHLRHPCLLEADFKMRVERLVTSGTSHPGDVQFLAFVYVVFACCDALLAVTSSTSHNTRQPSGWRWLQLADSLVDKRRLLSGCDEIAFVQYLLFQAIYFTFTDLPGLAYNTISLACTAAAYQNLNRQKSWPYLQTEGMYWRICLFWTIFVTDQSISASCGRPPHFSLGNVRVDMASVYYDKALLPAQQRTDEIKQFINQYQTFMIWWVQLVDKTIEKVDQELSFSNEVDNTPLLMDQFTSDVSGMRLPFAHSPDSIHLPFEPFMQLHALSPLLILGHRAVTGLNFDHTHASRFRWLALHAVEQVRSLRSGGAVVLGLPHQMTSAVAASLLVLGALLLKPTSSEHETESDIEAFRETVDILSTLAGGLPYARRVYDTCQPVISIVQDMIKRYHALPSTQRNVQNWETMAASIPFDVRNKFPYQIASPDFQGGVDMSQGCEGIEVDVDRSGNEVLWLL